MRIAVVGPGAMGCLFAARLAGSGLTVTLVDHNEERAAALAKSGITLDTAEGPLRARPIMATSIPKTGDLIIVLVKAYSTQFLSLPQTCPVLTLQNGLNNVEILCKSAGPSRVIAGATTEAATLLAPGHVRHTASGLTRFGAWTTCPTDTAELALRQAGFDVELTDAPGQLLWEKAAVNAAINPITALLSIPNGRLIETPELRQLMRDLVVEAVKVATTEGYRFDRSLVEYAEEVCAQTRDNISSMLQDVRAGKPTEIDALSGEILRRGQLANLPAPRTRVIWQLVKGLERR